MSARRPIVLVATLAAAALSSGLGAWQLDRAAQKQALQAAREQRRALPPLDAGALAGDERAAAEQQQRAVRLDGQWLGRHTVFLENRPLAGRTGFVALTPLALDDGRVVLVQRGWFPRDAADRTRIVAPPPPAGRVRVDGRVALAPPRLYELSPSTPASGPIRQNVDLAGFARETGLALLPLMVVQEDGDEPPSDGLLRRWPAPAADVHKHYGYAFQWFALAALVLALYVWFQLVRPRISFAQGSRTAPLMLTVHELVAPELLDAGAAERRRITAGRLKMLAVLAVCAVPVIASYLAYHVLRPEGRTNYGTLIQPSRALPDLQLVDLDGRVVAAKSLHGQWLLLATGPADCDTACEQRLYVQRQLRAMLGRERDRLDKVWLVTDDAPLRPELRAALAAAPAVTVLRAPRSAVAAWLARDEGADALDEHFYVVDPLGEWMMRLPAAGEPSKIKRDLERLLRASAGWDRPGR